MKNSSELSLVLVSARPFGDHSHSTVVASRKSGPTPVTPYRWLNSGSKSPRPVPAPKMAPDPYLLVLLARQQIEANRREEARTLIEAAYAAYDQCNFGS